MSELRKADLGTALRGLEMGSARSDLGVERPRRLRILCRHDPCLPRRLDFASDRAEDGVVRRETESDTKSVGRTVATRALAGRTCANPNERAGSRTPLSSFMRILAL